MPSDVIATIELLVTNGFSGTNERYGNMQSGSVLYDRLDISVLIISDRGQWMLDFVVNGTKLDFDSVLAARTGTKTWTAATSTPAKQLPVGVAWAPNLMETIEWLTTNPKAVDQVRHTQTNRAEDVFGSQQTE